MRVAFQNLYEKAFEKYRDELLDSKLISSISTSQSSPLIRKACQDANINYWPWEADLLQTMAAGKLVCQLSNRISLQILDCDPGKNSSRHMHKEYLRQLLAYESHYLYDLIYEYLWTRALHLAMESRATYSICYSLFHSFGDHIIAEAFKSIGLPVYIAIPDYIIKNTPGEMPYYLLYNYSTHKYVKKSYSTEKPNPNEIQRVAEVLHNCLEKDVYYSSRATDIIEKQTMHGKNEIIREIASGNNTGISTLAITTLIAECKRIVMGRQINSTEYANPFILWCLNLEPESTINPLGGYFYDTLLFGSLLTKICRSAGINLIVREHPAFLAMKIGSAAANAHIFNQPNLRPRSAAWYKQIVGIQGFKGFDNTNPISTILDHDMCVGVACINGTSCLNAIRRDKLALVGAAAWFSQHHTCATINTEKGIYKAVQLIKAFLVKEVHLDPDFAKLSLQLAKQYVNYHIMVESSYEGEGVMPSPSALLDITSSIRNDALM